MDEHPELRQVMIDARESILDFAEKVIWENMIQTKDPYLRQKAAEFTLSHLGRHRGWGQENFKSMEINVDPSSKDVKVKINELFGVG